MTMPIGELFEKDPKRHIVRVTSVQEHSPDIVYEELDEYVVTPAIRSDLHDIIDRLIESRRAPTENVCGWVSGFFGSGKSMFLKILGYVLANIELKLKNGETIESARFFLEKNSFPKAQSTILTKQLKVKSILVNMLDQDVAAEPSISKIVYSELLRDSGLSEVPWIAEVERTIRAQGLWQKFLEYVQEFEGQPWQKVRRLVVRARPVLARALQSLDPKTYASVEQAEKSIEDQEKNFQLRPSLLVERLLERAKELDPVEGRVMILLDEVGLYIGNASDRLADLNIFAEHVSKFGEGRVWLFVTAQEALEMVVARLEAVAGQFAKIRDRFQIMVKLSPENIDTVVKKRLLQKTADPSKLAPLRQLYKDHSGKLWTGALPSSIVTGRDYLGLFSGRDEDHFYESYPFMPYHIYLMQEIFDILRSRGGPAQALTGKERTVLSVVSAILSGIREKKGLADMPIGQLATFDMVYDAVDEELKAIRSAEQAAIGQRIAKLGQKGQVAVASVAKVIFFLQGVKWFPSTPENVAAVLYPRLGCEKGDLLNDVRDCISTLERSLWIRGDNGAYRFLSEFERTFEQMIGSKRQELTGAEKRQIIQEIMEKTLIDEQKFNKFVYRGVPFDVRIIADDKELNTKGHLELRVFSPFRSKDKGLLSSVTLLSRGQQNSIYWISDDNEHFEDSVERAICIEKVLAEFTPQSDADRQVVEEQRRNLRILKEDNLPHLFSRAAASGKIIYQGEVTTISNKRSLQEIYKAYVEEAIKEVFTEFDLAPYRVEKDPEDILAILRWRGGTLPKLYKELQLVDEQNNILTGRPVASRILGRLKDPTIRQEERTGIALADYFASPKFGWDVGVVKLTLATLVKNGSVMILSGGRELADPLDPAVQEVFRNQRAFNKTEFRLGEEEIPGNERLEASRLLSEFFGEKAEAPEELDRVLISAVDAKLKACDELLGNLNLLGLPPSKNLEALHAALQRIRSQSTRRRRIQTLVDKENSESIRSNIGAVKELQDFQKRGNFSKYQALSRFSQDIAPQLLSIEPSDENQKLVASLRQGLAAEDLVKRWSTVVGTFEKLNKRYRKLYTELHARRHDLLREALSSLKSNPAYRGMDEREKGTLLAPLAKLDCLEEKVSSDSSFACETCESSLERLSLDISRIDKIKGDIETELDRIMLKKRGEGRKAMGFTEIVSSKVQVSIVTKRIEDVAKEVLPRGKSLRIEVKEAEGDGQEKER